MADSLAERVCKTLEGFCLLELKSKEPFEDMVYRWCHIARGTCGNPHEDWLKDFEKAEACINEAMKAPAERGS